MRVRTPNGGAGVAVVTKVKLHNPMTAIDLLNKMDKLYADTAQPVTINADKVIVDARGKITELLNRRVELLEEHNEESV